MLNHMSKSASASGSQLVMRPIVMLSKLHEAYITRGTPKRAQDFLSISSNIMKGTDRASWRAAQSVAHLKSKHSLNGPTEKRLKDSMYSRRKRREKPESAMSLTMLFLCKARLFAGCMLNSTYRCSQNKRTFGNSINLAGEIVPFSVETRRRRIKSRCIKISDMELALTQNQGSSAGSASVARSSASVEAWIFSNRTSLGTGTSQTTPGFISGTVAAPTDSTVTGAFTVASLKTIIAAAWTAGGSPGIIMVGGTQKQTVSGFAGIATIYREAGSTSKGTAIVGAADLYISDFGEHRVVPNRFSRNRTALVLDMDYWAVSYLRKVSQKEIARTGGAQKRYLDVEFGLVSRNEAASGKISDLT